MFRFSGILKGVINQYQNESVEYMPSVSVIVPAYNAEKSLEKTIGDIIAQTYQDYEIIIVDDGSTDQTPIICDNLSKLNKRIQIIHQVNGGLSNARNNGTRKASGMYVTYIDSDDRIEKYYLEYLMRAIKEEKVDIACGRIDRVREDFNNISEMAKYSVEVFDTKETISEMLTGKKLTVGACCRMVPKEWQLRHPFLEGTYYEDLSNTYKINLLSVRTAFIDVILYHYVMRGGSITGRKVTNVKQCKDYSNSIDACYNAVINTYPELKKDAAVLKARDYMSLYLSIHRCNEIDEALREKEYEIREWIKKNWYYVASNKKAPKDVRLRTVLFRLSPAVYEKAYYIGIKGKGKAIG